MPTLNWIGKEAVIKHHKDVPYRLLEPVAELSCEPPLNPPNPPAPLSGGKLGEESGLPPDGTTSHSTKLSKDDSQVAGYGKGGLRGVRGETGNLIVQGDNLHALKALLPRYAGKVKCIYIDPPYNTGNEGWVYNDNVNSAEIKKWLGEVVGKEGETLDRHDRWLCMMYPRLLLLKQFLRDDGAIFVSIDDDEVHHLRLLMDEVFGANKRLATFVWRTDGNFDNQAKIKNCHEYVLAYAIKPELFAHPKVIDPSVGEGSKLNKPFIRNTIVKNGAKNPVSSVTLPAEFPADFDEGRIPARSNAWPHYSVDLLVKNGQLVNGVAAETGWSSRDSLLEFIKAKFQPVKDSKGQLTRFVITHTGAIESIKEREMTSHVISVVSGVGSTQSQSAALSEMGFMFPFPKPVELVKYLVSMVDDKECIVLDSFAGSGTTGHAVLKQNAEDGGKRRFILVEMDENIARNVTAERVRRVAQGYVNGKDQAVEGLGGGFQYCTLSKEPLFTADGQIRSDVTYAQLAEFVWFVETGTGLNSSTAFDRHSRASGNPDNQEISPHSGEQSQEALLIKPLDSRLRGNDVFGLSPLLGIHEGRAIYLLYNGILKDKSVAGGNVLTSAVFEILPAYDGAKVIYAAACRLGASRLHRESIVFKQTPYSLTI